MKRVIRITLVFFAMFITIYMLFTDSTFINVKAEANNNIKEINSINKLVYNSDGSVNLNYLYEEATDEVKQLMNDLNISNSIETYYVFEYLLSNGYLSTTHPTFTEDETKVLDLNEEELLGIDVIYGYMNCRHITDYYTKVLVKLGYNAYPLPCYITEDINDAKKFPNHVITVVNENDNTLYIDMTNKIIFNKYENEKYLSDFKNEYYALPIPEYSSYDKNVVVSHNTNEEIVYINKIIEENTKNYSSINLNKEYIKVNKIIRKNKNILNTFKVSYRKNILDNIPNKETYMTN